MNKGEGGLLGLPSFFLFCPPGSAMHCTVFLGGQGHPVRDRGRSRGHERRDFARIGDQRMTVCLSGALRPSLFLKKIFVSCLPTLSLTRTRTRRPRPPLALGAGDHQPRGPGRGRGPDPGAVYGTRPAGAAVFSICFSQCLSPPPPRFDRQTSLGGEGDLPTKFETLATSHI